MNTYQYYLFDWDGCLAKTLDVWLSAYKESIATRGIKPSDTDIARHFGDWELPKYFGVEDYEKCNADAVDIARQRLKEVSLYDGSKELLQKLKSDKKLALLSSASKDVLLTGLAHNGISDYFEVILSGEDVINHKPHPEVIQKALNALAGDKKEAVMIGDSRKDLGAAKNAGIDSILIYPPSHRIFYNIDELNKYNPTYTFASLAELNQNIASN
jgi:HAD superfamily hydrolase (TIGR01509 family)